MGSTKSAIRKFHIGSLKEVLSAANKDLDEVFKSLILQPKNDDGTRVGKYYPPQLEPFYKYFRSKVMNVQSSIGDLISQLGELELMKDSIETLIAFECNNALSCRHKNQESENRDQNPQTQVAD